MPNVPKDHPRYLSLLQREKIIQGLHQNVVAEAGLVAFGRGEAFDYFLGEETPDFAYAQERAAIAHIILAESPVLSVNGNVAALCPDAIVKLASITGSKLEVNLFYRTLEREKAIQRVLLASGAKDVLGVGDDASEEISEISHQRRHVDSRGILNADLVFVPLEDGDRTMALRKMGKKVLSIDLNPMSRTAIWSTITIVNNVVRAIPEMIKIAQELDNNLEKCKTIVSSFDNDKYLRQSVAFMANRLSELSKGALAIEVD